MTAWKRKLRIKHLLSSSNDPAVARETGKNIAKVIRASSWRAADIKDAGSPEDSEVAQLAEGIADVRSVIQLNACLTMLYDLADADRVFVE